MTQDASADHPDEIPSSICQAMSTIRSIGHARHAVRREHVVHRRTSLRSFIPQDRLLGVSKRPAFRSPLGLAKNLLQGSGIEPGATYHRLPRLAQRCREMIPAFQRPAKQGLDVRCNGIF